MKKSHYLRLLAYEPLILLGILLYGSWCSWSVVSRFRQDEDFVLGFIPDGTFGIFLVAMALPLLFKVPITGTKAPLNAVVYAELEFFFTRAISRRAIYWAKASRYLLVCLLPFLAAWAFSCGKPLIRVEAPFDAGKQPAMEQFYLAYFRDAHLETVPYKNIDLTYVVLPHGQMNRTFFTLAWVCFMALLFQLTSFIFWGKRRAMLVIWLAFILLPGRVFQFFLSASVSSVLNESSTFTPTFYEEGLSWVTLHTPLTLLILGLLAIVTQTYCCRRYINTEVTT